VNTLYQFVLGVALQREQVVTSGNAALGQLSIDIVERGAAVDLGFTAAE